MSSPSESLLTLSSIVQPLAAPRIAWPRRWRNLSKEMRSFARRCLLANRRAQCSARQLDEILASNPSAIFTFNLRGDVTYANARAFELLGVRTGARRGIDFDSTRWERRTLEGERLPEHLTPFRRVLAERAGFSDWRYRLRLPDGRWRVVATTALPLFDSRGGIRSVVVTTTDITDLIRLEQDNRQAQKLEGLGHLAGGVAHDFNNLLTGIFGYLDLLERNVATASTGVRADIGEIRSAAERAAWLTRQLLTFSRRQVVDRTRLRPESGGAKVGAVPRPRARRLRQPRGTTVGGSVPRPRRSGTGRAGRAEPGRERARRDAERRCDRDHHIDPGVAEQEASPHLPPGRYVVMRVRDEGVGMSEEVLPRIFEPYFTTKGPTKGTGIGLATVYGIVTQAHGAIRVCSTVGAGTTFTVFMPATTKEAPIEEGPTDEREVDDSASAGSILLVDDNDDVRLVTRRLMERAGLDVVDARNPAEALAIVESRPEPFAMLATDLVMPGMSGKALAQRLRAAQPDLPVLYLSGFASESVGDPLPGGPPHRFLAKPYSANELLSSVAALMPHAGAAQGAGAGS